MSIRSIIAGIYEYRVGVATGCGLVVGVLWLQLCLAPQVNSAILVQVACREVESRTVDGARPPSLESRDYWGRPFFYASHDDCYLIASYGSDGRADAAYDLSLCQVTTGRHPRQTSCWWPTMDTVYINGKPFKACGK